MPTRLTRAALRAQEEVNTTVQQIHEDPETDTSPTAPTTEYDPYSIGFISRPALAELTGNDIPASEPITMPAKKGKGRKAKKNKIDLTIQTEGDTPPAIEVL